MLNGSGPINYTIVEISDGSLSQYLTNLMHKTSKFLTVRLFAVYVKGTPAMISPEKEENLANVPRLLVSVRICVSVAQWLRCCVTNRKVAGSTPGGVIGIFQ